MNATEKPILFSCWPDAKTGQIIGWVVDALSGQVLRSKTTKWRHSRAWWKARGYSFNGRIIATATVPAKGGAR